jgi:hypothetical protein
MGHYPILVLDRAGVTYRPYEDPLTLLRRGPVVRLRGMRSAASGRCAPVERGPFGGSRSGRTEPDRVRGGCERWAQVNARHTSVSLSVAPVSEHKLVDELTSRAHPHTFTDERKA